MDYGLAEQSVQAGQEGMIAEQEAVGPDNKSMQEILAKVVELLKQGVTAQELIEQGVPEEVVAKAEAMLQINTQQNSTNQNAGLAELSLQ